MTSLWRRLRVFRVVVALGLTSAALGLQCAAAATMINKCEVTGQKGEYSIKPLIAGQLTVRGNLPSPGWWNGDTPQAVTDGFEYCMAANIAWRLGFDKVAVVYAAWGQVISGAARNFDLTLSQAPVFDKVIQSLNDDETLKKLSAKYLAAAWGTNPTEVPYFQPRHDNAH